MDTGPESQQEHEACFCGFQESAVYFHQLQICFHNTGSRENLPLRQVGEEKLIEKCLVFIMFSGRYIRTICRDNMVQPNKRGPALALGVDMGIFRILHLIPAWIRSQHSRSYPRWANNWDQLNYTRKQSLLLLARCLAVALRPF